MAGEKEREHVPEHSPQPLLHVPLHCNGDMVQFFLLGPKCQLYTQIKAQKMSAGEWSFYASSHPGNSKIMMWDTRMFGCPATITLSHFHPHCCFTGIFIELPCCAFRFMPSNTELILVLLIIRLIIIFLHFSNPSLSEHRIQMTKHMHFMSFVNH